MLEERLESVLSDDALQTAKKRPFEFRTFSVLVQWYSTGTVLSFCNPVVQVPVHG